MASGQQNPPPSFHYEFADDWGVWVLDHGLPLLTASLGEDDEVPIAYWAGPAFGAVLFRSWWSDAEEGETASERDVNIDHHSYVRNVDGWEATGGGGGTAGPEDDPMGRRQVPDGVAYLGGDWQEGPVRGITGLVGVDARTIEVTDGHGTTRRGIDAPLGWIVVCFDALDEAVVRVLDDRDKSLAEVIRRPSH